MDAFARILIGMYHRRIEYPSGVRAREEVLPTDGRSMGDPIRQVGVGNEDLASLPGSVTETVEPGVSSDASS